MAVSMDSYGDTWAIVLAGGDGTRLRALTTNLSGVAIPKQYCSLWGGPCLLEEALVRAGAVAPIRRTCAVVAAPHRRWWSGSLAHLPIDNVIVQPRNLGTGIGVLLAVLTIIDRDPYANVVLMPADHVVQDDLVMAAALRELADQAASDPDHIHILGAQPSEFDPEFAIVAASAAAFLGLYKDSHERAVAALEFARVEGNDDHGRRPLSAAYDDLSVIDFSRDVLEGQAALLRILKVPPCGWMDLGTPERVAKVLKMPPRRAVNAARSASRANLSLAAQWSALG
jgi:mannose-1-phosphate guanylyltransferase